MEKKIRSHVSLPLNLIKQFNNDNKVYVKDIKRNKFFPANGTKVGVEKGHYGEKCEGFLSFEEEGPFYELVEKVLSFSTNYEKTNFLNSNHSLLEKFIKIQFLRSVQMLDSVNKASITSKIFGPISHDAYISILAQDDDSLLDLIEGEKCARIVINESSDYSYIENSVGFYTINKIEKLAFCIPISPNSLIYIGRTDDTMISHYFTDTSAVKFLNKCCLATEKAIGNGFLIAHNENDFQSINENKDN